MPFDDSESRDVHGRWTRTLQQLPLGSKATLPSGVEVRAMNRGGRRKYVTTGGREFGAAKDAATHALTPPVLPWRDPPPPLGKAHSGAKAGGYTAAKAGRERMTNTQLGDLGEKLSKQLGMRSLLPPGKRQNPLDIEFDHSGLGYELKARTTDSQAYKTGLKAHEVAEKEGYAEEHHMRASTMMAVIDRDKGEAHFLLVQNATRRHRQPDAK